MPVRADGRNERNVWEVWLSNKAAVTPIQCSETKIAGKNPKDQTHRQIIVLRKQIARVLIEIFLNPAWVSPSMAYHLR